MKYMNLQIQEVQQTQSRRNAEIHVMTHNQTLEDNDKENTSQPFVLVSVWEKIKHVWSLITQIFCLFLLNSGNIKSFHKCFFDLDYFYLRMYFFFYH